jgi:hypothetical protein
MLWVKVKPFIQVRLLCFPECRRALLRCTKNALTLVVEFLNARVRNGLNAHVTVLSTTALVKKRVAQLRVEWIVSESPSQAVFLLLTPAQSLPDQRLVLTPLVKKPKDHTVSAEGTNHVCIN